MDMFKLDVYDAACVYIDKEIFRLSECISHWGVLIKNPLHIMDYYAPSMGMDEVHDACREDTRCLEQMVTARAMVPIYVDGLLTEIQVLMSDQVMTHIKLHTISVRIDHFMRVSGLPWISSEQVDRLRVFLFASWGLYRIPTNKDEAWSIIPMIGRQFKQMFDMFRSTGMRMPCKRLPRPLWNALVFPNPSRSPHQFQHTYCCTHV